MTLPDDWRGFFVARDGEGVITGIYAHPVVGVAEEPVADDDADLLAFLNPPPTAKELRKAVFKVLPDRADLVTRLKTATPAEIDTWLTNNVTNLAQARTVLGAILKYLATMNGD